MVVEPKRCPRGEVPGAGMRIQGPTYVRVLPLEDETDHHPMRWALTRGSERQKADKVKSLELRPSEVRVVEEAIARRCPLAQNLQRWGVEPGEEYEVRFRFDEAKQEVGVVLDPEEQGVGPRQVAVRAGGEPEFVSALSPLYEKLAYPLIFEDAQGGWGAERKKPEHYGLKQVKKNNRLHGVSQREYYASVLRTDKRLSRLWSLKEQYVVDAFIRLEEERLWAEQKRTAAQRQEQTEEQPQPAEGQHGSHLSGAYTQSPRWYKEKYSLFFLDLRWAARRRGLFGNGRRGRVFLWDALLSGAAAIRFFWVTF